MDYDVIVIGAGLSGLTAASLLAKRGLKVLVVEHGNKPGGSCGIFKRGTATFEQGAAMLYGFGEKGFNAHRFVFNCLEEPITLIRHEKLYCVNYNGHRIEFTSNLKEFTDQLGQLFPEEKEQIKRFYHDMYQMYQHVIVDDPAYTTPDEVETKDGMKKFMKHPKSYATFLRYLNCSVETLLKKYFTTPEIFHFFDKLTSTYCYTTVKEAPAILGAVMFIDNHVGGSYYPVGTTLNLVGKLEKVIEEHDGELIYKEDVRRLIIKDNCVCGVRLNSGMVYHANALIYSGTAWDLYEGLLPQKYVTKEKRDRIRRLEPSYSSVVLYLVVKREYIPEGTLPIEMIASNPETIDEGEITVYLLSIDDKTLCEQEYHVIEAIGPSFSCWNHLSKEEYDAQKERESKRMLDVLATRFHDIQSGIVFSELATPKTLNRYVKKYHGSVAGPKQKLGQHLFARLHTKSGYKGLYCCGESTVMGTGTPAVTTSGISAANAVLKQCKLQPYRYDSLAKNYVTIISPPVTNELILKEFKEEEQKAVIEARKCQYCEYPCCCKNKEEIPGIMRRVAVGNFIGAKRRAEDLLKKSKEELDAYQTSCKQSTEETVGVDIASVLNYLRHL